MTGWEKCVRDPPYGNSCDGQSTHEGEADDRSAHTWVGYGRAVAYDAIDIWFLGYIADARTVKVGIDMHIFRQFSKTLSMFLVAQPLQLPMKNCDHDA